VPQHVAELLADRLPHAESISYSTPFPESRELLATFHGFRRQPWYRPTRGAIAPSLVGRRPSNPFPLSPSTPVLRSR
jgi:hypothetical protein